MKNIRVLIDFSQIPIQKVGVGVYGLNLVLNLRPKVGLQYFVLIQDDDNCLESCETNGITIIKINSKVCRKTLIRLVMEQVYLPYLVFKYKIDVVHSLHYSFPILAKAKKIVTVHDLTFFKYPAQHLRSKVLYFRLFIWLTSLFANKVICVSKSTELDYCSYFKVSPFLTTVIEHGKDQTYRPNIDQSEIIQVLKKYEIIGNYILFIGTIEPRKNISNILLAFARLVAEGCHYYLVIVGKKGWHFESVFSLIKELHLSSRVIFTGFVDETEKPPLLVGAKIFVYPSFYEGFGIPVLESLACGTPTITSNISSMPEVAGDAAVLVDPYNVEDIYAALVKLYKSESLCEDLRRRGLLQAKKFSWQESAEKTAAVYAACS